MKTRKIISIILITLLLSTTKVYAANNSYSTTIKASSNEVKREKDITITIGLSNIAIESGEKGIGAYTAKIVYDSSVLEYVTTNGTDKWDSPFYQNGLITSTTKDGTCVNTNQNIGTITFKVKKDAKIGNTTIKLTNFYGSIGVVSNGEESDIKAQDKQVTIKVVGEPASTPTSTTKPTATPKPTTIPTPTNTPRPTSTAKPNNTSKPTATVKPSNKPSSNGSGSNKNNTNSNNSNNNISNNVNNNDNNTNQINDVENVNIIGNAVQEINSNNTNENVQENNTQNLGNNILNVDNTEETDDYSMLIWIAVIIFFGIVIAIIVLIILNKKMK